MKNGALAAADAIIRTIKKEGILKKVFSSPVDHAYLMRVNAGVRRSKKLFPDINASPAKLEICGSDTNENWEFHFFFDHIREAIKTFRRYFS